MLKYLEEQLISSATQTNLSPYLSYFHISGSYSLYSQLFQAVAILYYELYAQLFMHLEHPFWGRKVKEEDPPPPELQCNFLMRLNWFRMHFAVFWLCGLCHFFGSLEKGSVILGCVVGGLGGLGALEASGP
jgi:hypothetical protein